MRRSSASRARSSCHRCRTRTRSVPSRSGRDGQTSTRPGSLRPSCLITGRRARCATREPGARPRRTSLVPMPSPSGSARHASRRMCSPPSAPGHCTAGRSRRTRRSRDATRSSCWATRSGSAGSAATPSCSTAGSAWTGASSPSWGSCHRASSCPRITGRTSPSPPSSGRRSPSIPPALNAATTGGTQWPVSLPV